MNKADLSGIISSPKKPNIMQFLFTLTEEVDCGIIYYEGREYDFNFSKLHLMVKTEFSFEETDEVVIWHVRQENIHAVMETEVHCLKKDMLFVNYEAPDGSKRHNRLWNGGNGWGTVKLYDKRDGQLELVDEIEATHIGCEYGEYAE